MFTVKQSITDRAHFQTFSTSILYKLPAQDVVTPILLIPHNRFSSTIISTIISNSARKRAISVVNLILKQHLCICRRDSNYKCSHYEHLSSRTFHRYAAVKLAAKDLGKGKRFPSRALSSGEQYRNRQTTLCAGSLNNHGTFYFGS